MREQIGFPSFWNQDYAHRFPLIVNFWLLATSTLQGFQSPRTCLSFSIDLHTSAIALLKLGTSNIAESLPLMGYGSLNKQTFNKKISASDCK